MAYLCKTTASWTPAYCFFIFDEKAGSSTVKHSYLKQGHEHVYGDNSVYNVHFECTTKPFCDEVPQDAWDGENDYKRYNPYGYQQWKRSFHGGVNTLIYEDYYYELYYVPQVESITRYEARFTEDGERWAIYQTTYWHSLITGEESFSEGWGETLFYKYYDTWLPSYAWIPYFFGIVSDTCTYQLLSPVPYYWLEYCENVRPYIRPDALSECIRNTIQQATVWDTNSYANIADFIGYCKDVRDADVAKLIKDSRDLWKQVCKAYARKSGSNVTKFDRAFARKALRNRFAKGSANAWLKYRYVYNTTRMDFESKVRRFGEEKFGESFAKLTPDQVLRGSIGIEGGRLSVKMRLHDQETPTFDRLLISMNQYGFFPGLYNVWDLIPFSFVADWFSNLGDHLQDIDQSIFFRYYRVDELLVSYTQQLEKKESFGDVRIKYYNRDLLASMPQWEIYEEDPASGKVRIKRAIDTLSLAISAK